MAFTSSLESMLSWRARRKIFLSYRRADTQAIAERVYEGLCEYFGASNIFLDRPDIEPGQRWRDELATQIGAADTVLALIGPGWLESLQARAALDDVLRFELASALAQNKHIVPVLVGTTPMPDSALLPPELRGLGQFQALVINAQDIDHAMRELLGRLKPGWGLAVAWAFANQLGWLVGLLVLILALMAFGCIGTDHPGQGASLPPVIGFAIAGALLGICVGVPQWLILRLWFDRARYLVPLYVILSAIAIGFPGAIAGEDSTRALAVSFLMILVLPIGLGTILWAIVRKDINHAGWWSAANIAAPFAGLMIAGAHSSSEPSAVNPVNLGALAYFFVTMVVPALTSGLLLVWLMRRSEMKRK
jgi:hypothetical protein